ncbi:hypothetical protein [Methanolapillus millepedarum]|uniref:Uncharacterized protein n=1 Tax=Methanolapillus millepedarum TaxID=3028296 RepID=A0AA96ZU42_9EURY|nr:hypothetical protein MsAc7_07650 [Methanosarcinaceae archaeon Ac7]
MSDQDYAGAYMGWSEEIGFTISIFKPDGTSAHFADMWQENYYYITHGRYSIKGTEMTTWVYPIFSPGTVNEGKAFLFLGEKIVHDHSKSRQEDYEEYYISGYDVFWDSVDFNNPAVNDDGSVPPGPASKLKEIALLGKSKVESAAKPSKKNNPRKTSSGNENGEKFVDSPPSPPQPKPEQPYMLICNPPSLHIFVQPPRSVEGENPPEPEKRRWRRAREQGVVLEGFIDESRDCEELTDPAELISGKSGTLDDTRKRNTVHLHSVFVFQNQMWVNSYYANIYSFIGMTLKGEAVTLPVFISAKRGQDVPWRDMLSVLKSVVFDIDYFVYKDYDNIVEKCLKEIYPNTVYVSSIWDLPTGAPIKKRAEELHRISEKEVKEFWYSPGNIENIGQLQDIVELFIERLDAFFENYIYQSPLDQPDVNSVQNGDINRVVEKIPASISEPPENSEKPETIKAEDTGCAENAGRVNYCFVFERSFWLPDGMRSRVAVFNQVSEGCVIKSVLAALPETAANSDWEAAINKAAVQMGDIKYLLFQGCSINRFSVNMQILPNTVWCSNIGDFDYTEKSREKNCQKLNELDNHLSAFSRSCENVQHCFEVLREHLKLIGITEIDAI